MEEERPPITDAEKVVILFLAVLLDALSVIPGLGTVVAFLGLFSIGIWSWVRLGKMPLTKKLRKYITKRAFIFLVEALPIAQIFPGWTVMALMGFRRGAQPSGNITVALALVVGIALFPGQSFALELTYPSFFPLQEGLQLNELVQLIFTASLVIGAIIAFLSLVYTGFEYIVSGADAGKRSAARKHAISTIIGIAILLGSVVLLRLINPNLVTIPPLMIEALNIEAPALTPPNDAASEEVGAGYSRLRLSDNLAALEDALNRIEGEQSSLLDIIEDRMSECSANLCTPGSIPYAELVEVDCSYTDEEGNAVSATCPQCLPATCTGTLCVGEPLPDKADLAQSVQEAQELFAQLQNLYRSAESGKTIISSCAENSISCVSLRAGGSPLTCDPAQDFFCGPSSSPSATLPLRELAETEEKFLKITASLTAGVLGATCANTTFSCDGGCGVATGQCTPSGSPSGCPPELFEATETLSDIANGMTSQQAQLVSIIESADFALDLALQTGGAALLLSCAEARGLVSELKQSGIYRDGVCATETTCCPSSEVEQALQRCDPVDLFLCS